MVATGLDGVDLDITPSYELAVVKPDGSTVLVKGDGTMRPLDLPGGDALRIAADPDGGYLVATDTRVRHHRLGPVTEHDLAAADLVAGCDEAFAATVDGVFKLVANQPPAAFGTKLPGIHGLTRIDCDTVVAWTADEVHLVEAEGTARLLQAPAVAAVAVKDGVVWIAHGEPPVLSREEDGRLVGEIPLPPGTRAMTWGNGYGFAADHLYLLHAGGISAVKP